MDFAELSRTVLADVARCVGRIDPARIAELVEELAARRRVFLLGTGRSGKILEAAAIRLGHLGIEARLLGAPEAPPVREGALVLVGSGSGETPRVVELATAARRAGARLVLLTAAPGSTAAKLADAVVHIPAPAEASDGTPHTLRSLFEECLLVTCDGLCRMLQERLGLTAADLEARHSPTH